MKGIRLDEYVENAIKGNFDERKVYSPASLAILTQEYIVDTLNQDLYNYILGNGLCPDELSRSLIDYFVDMVGKNKEFQMGRVNGVLKGDAMIGAMSHHVPNDGGSIVLNASHVGINSNGEYGKVNRFGQSEDSTCCGAGMGYLKKYKEYISDGVDIPHETIDISDAHGIEIVENILIKSLTEIIINGSIQDDKVKDIAKKIYVEVTKYNKENPMNQIDVSRDYDFEIMSSMLDPYMDEIIESDNQPLSLTRKMQELILEDFETRGSKILSEQGNILYINGIDLNLQASNGKVENLFYVEKVLYYEKGSNTSRDITEEFL